MAVLFGRSAAIKASGQVAGAPDFFIVRKTVQILVERLNQKDETLPYLRGEGRLLLDR